jgi:hypothetical protein
MAMLLGSIRHDGGKNSYIILQKATVQYSVMYRKQQFKNSYIISMLCREDWG